MVDPECGGGFGVRVDCDFPAGVEGCVGEVGEQAGVFIFEPAAVGVCGAICGCGDGAFEEADRGVVRDPAEHQPEAAFGDGGGVGRAVFAGVGDGGVSSEGAVA